MSPPAACTICWARVPGLGPRVSGTFGGRKAVSQAKPLTCDGDVGAAGGQGPCTVAAGVAGAGLLAVVQHLLAEGASVVWEEDVRVQTGLRGPRTDS